MAEQAVKKDIIKKPIKYKRNDNNEEENLNTLVAERDAALKQEEDENKGGSKRVIIVSGSSGTGKSTLIKRLMEDYPGCFSFSISYTTR